MATMTWPGRSACAWLGATVVLCMALLVPTVAAAQHRARMSSDLAATVAAGGLGSLQVLVEAPQDEVDRIARTYGVRVVRRLALGALLEGSAGAFDVVADDARVGAISENAVVTSTMSVTTQSTGASQLWADPNGRRYFDGITGAGVGVAVLDSGVCAHPDLAKRLAVSLDFTDGDQTVCDGYGHGTHVAGIIAGSGRGSRNSDGTVYLGMAPGADLISLRVLGSDGTGFAADVIRAIDWAVSHRFRHKIRVINLSLGHVPTTSYQDDPLAQAVERAVSAGIVVVSSAGNWGKKEDGTPLVGMIVSPGYTPGALTVGALNTKNTVARSDDSVATYSSRGIPSAWSRHLFWPSAIPRPDSNELGS